VYSTLTSLDQGNGKADVDTTAQIRKGIIAGKNMRPGQHRRGETPHRRHCHQHRAAGKRGQLEVK
jgi:hypothetical protein